ncbi:MAG: hypothetical protein ACRCUJ_06545 [Phocaeicola sp.]
MKSGELSSKNKNSIIPTIAAKLGKHCIMDSGLFTLMFGADKHIEKDEAFLTKWMHTIVAFVNQTGFTGTCVEVDCQKILSPEAAWKFRKEYKRLLPNNRIINVYHMEDGKEGLDRLIEFSDYIAISVPELRIHKSKTYKRDVHNLAKYIKSKKPEVDIHLLGCTEPQMLKDNWFCTSADSTTWTSLVRWPQLPFVINGTKMVKHISELDESKLIEHYKEKLEIVIERCSLDRNTKSIGNLAKILLAAETHLHQYDYLLGKQR